MKRETRSAQRERDAVGRPEGSAVKLPSRMVGECVGTGKGGG